MGGASGEASFRLRRGLREGFKGAKKDGERRSRGALPPSRIELTDQSLDFGRREGSSTVPLEPQGLQVAPQCHGGTTEGPTEATGVRGFLATL